MPFSRHCFGEVNPKYLGSVLDILRYLLSVWVLGPDAITVILGVTTFSLELYLLASLSSPPLCFAMSCIWGC